jgi:putative endonuclease
MAAFFVYVLMESDRRCYAGMTEDPESRLQQHNRGDVKSTAAGGPYGMVLVREETTGKEARRSERYFKSGFGRKHLDRHLAKLARCPAPGEVISYLACRARSSMVSSSRRSRAKAEAGFPARRCQIRPALRR